MSSSSEADDVVYDGTDYGSPIDEEEVYYIHFATNPGMAELTLEGRTMYVGPRDEGLTFAREAKAVVIQVEDGKTVKSEYSSVEAAVAALAEPDGYENTPGQQYEGIIAAVLNSQGVAEWIVFHNDNDLETGSGIGTSDGNYRATVNRISLTVTVTYSGTYDEDRALEAAVDALEAAGYELEGWTNTAPLQAIVTNANGGSTYFTINAVPRN